MRAEHRAAFTRQGTSGYHSNNMIENATAYDEQYAREGIYGNLLVKSSYIVISVIGITGNSIAIFVLRRSSNSQNALSNILLVNQSLADLFSCVLLVLLLYTSTMYTDIGWFGWRGRMFCWFWISDYWLYSSLMISSFNLVAVSVERALSIAVPLFHRTHVTRKSVTLACAAVWVAGLGIQLAFMMPTTRLMESHGHCVDWDVFPSDTHRMVFGLSLFSERFMFPVVFILASSAIIYNSLRKRFRDDTSSNSGQHIRMQRNVLKTLITVIICYIACNSLNSIVYLAYTLGVKIKISGSLYGTAVVVMYANTAVNPIVYTFQYREYQKELKKIFNIIIRRSTRVSDVSRMDIITIT